jgi:hypothetical protein
MTRHLVCLEPEKQLCQASKKKLIGDDEHGWTSENSAFLILKADATL